MPAAAVQCGALLFQNLGAQPYALEYMGIDIAKEEYILDVFDRVKLPTTREAQEERPAVFNVVLDSEMVTLTVVIPSKQYASFQVKVRPHAAHEDVVSLLSRITSNPAKDLLLYRGRTLQDAEEELGEDRKASKEYADRKRYYESQGEAGRPKYGIHAIADIRTGDYVVVVMRSELECLGDISVSLRIPRGEKVTISVSPAASVGSLMKLVQEKWSIPIANQRLSVGRQVLKRGDLLFQCDIVNKTEISVGVLNGPKNVKVEGAAAKYDNPAVPAIQLQLSSGWYTVIPKFTYDPYTTTFGDLLTKTRTRVWEKPIVATSFADDENCDVRTQCAETPGKKRPRT